MEHVELQSTLRRIERSTFQRCPNLKNVVLPGKLEYIGTKCFYDSKIEYITLPGTLREAGVDILKDCKKLKIVWDEEGCKVDVRKYVNYDVDVQYK